MQLNSPITVGILASIAAATSPQTNSSLPGYFTGFTTEPGNNFTFGQNYAVLNLDMIIGLVATINTTTDGQRWIDSTSQWINAVHQQTPPPLSIYTRFYFSNTYRPEIVSTAPVAKAFGLLGNITSDSLISQIYPAFRPLPDYDVVLQKTRYEAQYGNALTEILRTQKIDTVIVSGIRTSGVILATIYRLFDDNFIVYVITNNTIETAPDTIGIDRAIKEGIIPKLPAHVITVEQAIAALGRSGPALVYQ